MKNKKTIIVAIFLFVLAKTLAIAQSQNQNREVVGFVTADAKPLENVSVSVKGDKKMVFTDANGKYAIKVQPKQVLVFAYAGKETLEIAIEEVTRVLNIKMIPKVERLNEVVVAKKRLSVRKRMEQEYPFNKNIVKTAFGYLDARSSAQRIMAFDEYDVEGSGAMDVLEFIQQKTGARIVWDEFGSRLVVLRAFSFLNQGRSTTAAFDIDGVVSRDLPFFIPITDVKKIAIIYGPSQANLYGNLASNGLIIINTISANYKSDPDNPDMPYDYARLRGNKYKNDAVKLPNYNFSKGLLGALADSKTEEEALTVFKDEKSTYDHLPFYLLDVASYFKTVWNNTEVYTNLLKEIEANFVENPEALKALAYYYDARAEYNDSNKLYEKILKLRPDYAQSYRDLAASYSDTKSFNKALGIYARYEAHIRTDSIFAYSEIDSIVRTESKNLGLLHGNKIVDGLSEEVYKDVWPVRMLLEWSHSNAEFDIQLVHPYGNYYLWQNSDKDNSGMIEIHKKLGYTSKQFYIDDLSKGNWKVNIKYFGNRTFEPTYLKATVYYDYNNSVGQTKEVKVFKLSELNQNFSLLELSSSSILLSLTE